MSEDGDQWTEYRKERREKRAKNRDASTKIIKKWVKDNNGLLYEYTTAHFRINERFDFWPGTGKYLDRTTGEYKRGVFELIKELNEIYASTATK